MYSSCFIPALCQCFTGTESFISDTTCVFNLFSDVLRLGNCQSYVRTQLKRQSEVLHSCIIQMYCLFHVKRSHFEFIAKSHSNLLLTTNICLFLPCPCSLNTVIFLWTLHYTKHQNWFHENLLMEIFTKLPLKI